MFGFGGQKPQTPPGPPKPYVPGYLSGIRNAMDPQRKVARNAAVVADAQKWAETQRAEVVKTALTTKFNTIYGTLNPNYNKFVYKFPNAEGNAPPLLDAYTAKVPQDVRANIEQQVYARLDIKAPADQPDYKEATKEPFGPAPKTPFSPNILNLMYELKTQECNEVIGADGEVTKKSVFKYWELKPLDIVVTAILGLIPEVLAGKLAIDSSNNCKDLYIAWGEQNPGASGTNVDGWAAYLRSLPEAKRAAAMAAGAGAGAAAGAGLVPNAAAAAAEQARAAAAAQARAEANAEQARLQAAANANAARLAAEAQAAANAAARAGGGAGAGAAAAAAAGNPDIDALRTYVDSPEFDTWASSLDNNTQGQIDDALRLYFTTPTGAGKLALKNLITSKNPPDAIKDFFNRAHFSQAGGRRTRARKNRRKGKGRTRHNK